MKTKKIPGKARKPAAVKNSGTTTDLVDTASDGQDQGDTQQVTISRLRASKRQDKQADYKCGVDLEKRGPMRRLTTTSKSKR